MIKEALNVGKYVENDVVLEHLEKELTKAFNNGIFINGDLSTIVKNKSKLKLKLLLSNEFIRNKKRKSYLPYFLDVVENMFEDFTVEIKSVESLHKDSIFCKVLINDKEIVLPLKHISSTNFLRVKRLVIGEVI